MVYLPFSAIDWKTVIRNIQRGFTTNSWERRQAYAYRIRYEFYYSHYSYEFYKLQCFLFGFYLSYEGHIRPNACSDIPGDD